MTLSPGRLFARWRPTRERSGAALLALLVEGLIALALFYFLSPALTAKKEIVPMAVFGIETPKGATDASETSKSESRRRPRSAERKRVAQQPETKPPVPVPSPSAEPVPPGPPTFLKMSRNDYRAADIGKLASHPDSGSSDDDQRRGAGGVTDDPIGKGPRGESLYAADWYRRPTRAELNGYLSARAMGNSGWGEIVCTIVRGYRVEDCRELAESPRGSGWAGSVRQAAWQFRVRPPRRNGQELWDVQIVIHIDYEMLKE